MLRVDLPLDLLSSLMERVTELWEPRPESQEDASDGMSSHNMNTRSFVSVGDLDTLRKKPELPFLCLDLFFKVSILKSAAGPQSELQGL